MTIVDLSVLATLWLWALWGPAMRSARTVGVLGLTTAAYAGTALIDPIFSIVARGLVLAACVYLLLFQSRWFLSMQPEEWEFDRAFHDLRRQLGEIGRKRTRGEMSPEEYVMGVERLIPQFEELDAPGPDWASVKIEAIETLRNRLQRYREAGATAKSQPPQPDSPFPDEHHLQVRSRRLSFWR
jgi:hypothetical protein